MNRKIWILNHYASLPSEFGGSRHYDFSVELVKRGYDVTIFAASYNHFNKTDRIGKEEGTIKNECIDGVRFVWLKTFLKYNGNGISRLINMFSYLIVMLKVYPKFEKPDVVIGSSVHLFACLAGYFISKSTGSRFICEIRDLWPQTLIDMGAISKNHPLAVFFRIIEKFVYEKAERIIVLLPNTYDYIKRYNIEESKLVYIPNGVDMAVFDRHLQDSSLVLEERLENDLNNSFCCIYTGSIGIANCMDTVIKAAEIINRSTYDIKFIIVGEGAEKGRLIDYCRENNVVNVTFHPSVRKELIPKILGLSDIALIASRKIELYKYGISFNKLFDYLCARKPVVFACRTSNDIIRAANAGISIEPEDPNLMAEAIIELYEMGEEKRKTLGDNGRQYVKDNHDIIGLVSTLENCLY